MKNNNHAQVKLIDTTLREGEQAPGVFFTLEQKKYIINELVNIGIDEIEIGVAGKDNNQLQPLAKYIHNNHPQQSFSLWSRCRKTDITHAARLQPTCLSLSIPASDLHLQTKLGKDRKWAVKTLRQSIKQALTVGIAKVAVGLEDASRAEPDFIIELARAAETAGAFRLRLADTVGICTPSSITQLLESLDETGLELGVHCHNDFGMATANTITALEHVAEWGDVTLLGLGERAGNSRLEEVLAFFVLQNTSTAYNLTGLPELSRQVAGEINFPIAPTRPIIGKDLFSCETGLHLQGLMADPATYEPFAPEFVGARRRLLIGRQAGRRSIAATLGRLGLPRPDEKNLTRLTRQVRSLAAMLDRPLGDHEIIQIATTNP